MEKEILNEKDVLENYFYLIVTCLYKYDFTIRFFFKNRSALRLVNKKTFSFSSYRVLSNYLLAIPYPIFSIELKNSYPLSTIFYRTK